MKSNETKDNTQSRRKIRRKNITELLKKRHMGKVKIENLVEKKDFSKEPFLTNKEALEFLKRQELLKKYKRICHFGGIKWWVKDDGYGVYRYFIESYSGNAHFDILDMFVMSGNCNAVEARNRMFEYYNIKTIEGAVKEMNREKYIQNIRVIEEMYEKRWKYPHFWKLSEKQLGILEKLQCIAIGNLENSNEIIDGDVVFFSSVGHIAKVVENKSPSSVSKAVNLFALLGIVEKVNEKILSEDILKAAKIQMSLKQQKGNLISFFILPELTPEKMVEVEKMAKRIRYAGLNMSNITTERVCDMLGYDAMMKVYGNTHQNTKFSMIGKAQASERRKEYGYEEENDIEF